jgi:type VI protein secretion system component Hcp
LFEVPYSKIGLITHAVTDTGMVIPAGSFGFDLSTNIAIDPTTLPMPTPGLTPAGSAAAKYFLLIDGVKGDSTEAQHVGWFEIDGFDLDVSSTAAGSTTFSPLMVSMPLDGILSRLLADIAPGTLISSIKLEGVTAGDRPTAVYDLTLADVLVRQVHDEDGGTDRVAFDYSKIGLITHAVTDTGMVIPAGSFRRLASDLLSPRGSEGTY